MIVLDSNVYVSALYFRKGNPFEIVVRALSGRLKVAISEVILAETLGVLRAKFNATSWQLAEAEQTIRACTHFVTPSQKLHVIAEDPDDDRILECAITAGATVIVTGDKDLLRLRQYGGIKIMTPAQFLQTAQPL
ncbi:MAG: putative toxin-antitoxin system toxin component, PIN family [Bryobacterales bacterium]|nr:putative toxin-antitoxin system toxin component, PIN family [Bryobacterales bacterium]